MPTFLLMLFMTPGILLASNDLSVFVSICATVFFMYFLNFVSIHLNNPIYLSVEKVVGKQKINPIFSVLLEYLLAISFILEASVELLDIIDSIKFFNRFV